MVVLRDGMLCQEQDSLPGGISRESSMCERREPGAPTEPSLAKALKDDWLGGPASHPLQEHGGAAEVAADDGSDEYEGAASAGASSEEYSDVGEQGGQDTEVVYLREGVCVFPSASRRQRILGRLSLIKQYNYVFLCWLPYAAGAVQQEDGGGAGGPVEGGSGGAGRASAAEGTKDRTMYAIHPIPLSDIRAVHKRTPPLGQHRITLTLASGVSLPSLHFQSGGVKAFLSCLRQYAPLARSADDPNTYLVNDTADPLQRSLCSLELTDAGLSRPPPGSFASPQAGAAAGWQEGGEGLRAHLNELVDRFHELTQNARDTASLFLSGSVFLGGGGGGFMTEPSLPALASAAGAAAARAGGAGSSGAGEAQRRASLEASTDVGGFELIEGGAAAAGSAPSKRPPPLSLAELHTFFDADGRLTSVAAFHERVLRGGVEPEARPEAWKLLLGLHAPGSTRAQRQAEVRRRRQRYARLRAQWRSMEPAQQAKCSKWRERRTRIDKDVRRTDRGQRLFAREGGQAQCLLRGVLLSYERYNQDLGYVQGMSDLAAPCLYVMRGAAGGSGRLGGEEALGVEAEAFWCFASLMERMEANFSSDSRSMHAQLLALRSLVRLLDPPLHAHLEAHDCLSFFFCYRWLLILFKRELPFEEVLRLWEALWAGQPGLHLYLCVAVLEHHRRHILSEGWDFDGMLKFCVELGGRLRLEPLLRDAEKLAEYAGQAGRDIVAEALAAAGG